MMEDGPVNGMPHIHLYMNGTYCQASYNCCEYSTSRFYVNGSTVTCSCGGGTIVIVG